MTDGELKLVNQITENTDDFSRELLPGEADGRVGN